MYFGREREENGRGLKEKVAEREGVAGVEVFGKGKITIMIS